MINEINETIYNYIFSVNEERRGNNINEKECEEKLDELILTKYDVIADFWNENENYFNDKCVLLVETFEGQQHIYINFPRMKADVKLEFLELKKEKIKQSIDNNGEFLVQELGNVFENIENIGIKSILDYCKDKNIIKYTGNVFLAADNNPAYAIIYQNIKAVIQDDTKAGNGKNILKTGFLIEYEMVQKEVDSSNAEIWLVKDKEEKEYIAKILNKNISAEKLKRYRNEINFCRYLNNNHLIKIIDNGIKNIGEKDYMFYIMPKFTCDFRKIMNSKIDDSKVLGYFNQILEGVKFIHSRKGFHRDIKPENILYDAENDILVVSDLGIAHFNDDDLIDDPRTKKSSKMANYMYAAPEQRVKGGQVDYRCDIYSLGLILNEIFTGRIIQGNNYKKIRDVNENFKFLDPIVERMTNQEPDDRYQSIEEVQFAINASVSIHNLENQNKKIEGINYDNNDEDALVNDPIKIVDVKITENYQLIIVFNNSVNDLWIETLGKIDKKEILGYGPERYSFYRNQATLDLNKNMVESVPKLVDYFKDWIEKTNRLYPVELKKKNAEERRLKEQKMMEKIKENEKLQQVLKSIKI